MTQSFFKHPLVLLLVGLALGCAAHAVTSSVVVAAQSQPERAIYRQCISVQLDGGTWLSADQLAEGRLPPQPVNIPDGWHVAAGGGGGSPNLILCR